MPSNPSLPLSPTPLEPNAPARVVRVDRGFCQVQTPAGVVHLEIATALLSEARANSALTPCVGDLVVVREDRIVEVLPRRTSFRRLSSSPGSSQEQVLAANVDIAVLVEPLLPEPHVGRIERLLALAWESGAQPLIVLTKADLVRDADVLRDEVSACAPGVDVLVVSASTGEGIEVLSAYCYPGATLVLLGPSGAGKSSLLNALGGEAETGTTRADGKGRHTTVHRELRELASGACVIDTPGLRTVGVSAGEEALARAFSDIEALAAECRFGDCAHSGEPGCAVVAALERGELAERRLLSWRALEREAAYIARRQDVRAQAAERAKWRAVTREMRRSGRPRP